MPIIDLSHPIKSGDLVFEGMKKPKTELLRTVEEHGFAITSFTLHSHNGTHVDAPSHMLANAKTLSDFSIEKYSGQGTQIPCQNYITEEIPLSYLKSFQKSVEKSDFIILNSAWSKKWNTPSYYKDFPVLSEESAIWLTKFNLKGIAIDAVSIDHIESQNVPIHKILLSNEIIIIENLNNLDALPLDNFIFQCFPLNSTKLMVHRLEL